MQAPSTVQRNTPQFEGTYGTVYESYCSSRVIICENGVSPNNADNEFCEVFAVASVVGVAALVPGCIAVCIHEVLREFQRELGLANSVINSGGPAAMEGHTGTAGESGGESAVGSAAGSAAGLVFLWHDHRSPSSVQAEQTALLGTGATESDGAPASQMWSSHRRPPSRSLASLV